MERRVTGAILGLFFIVVAVAMAFDINDMQVHIARSELEELGRLQLWKITTLFVGGILAAATVLILSIRSPS